MKAIIQRTNQASVCVQSKIEAKIGLGIVVFAGIARDDTERQADYLAGRIPRMRIFEDSEGKMNRDLLEVGGSLLLVSNFTVVADCRKGRRPSFDMAAPPERARILFDYLAEGLRRAGVPVQTGVFQAHMEVSVVNAGPVTLILESP